MANPFTPNFGQIPTYLAGRDYLIQEVMRALENGVGDPSLASIFVGARGTGKTALLSYFAREAQQHGWIAANTSCTKGLLEDIYQQAAQESAHLIDKPQEKKLSGITFGSIVGAEWENVSDYSPNWRTRMNTILDGLAEHNTGLLITIDEVDPKLEEMLLLATIYQHFVRENRKVALLMAGLPSQVSNLLNNKTTSFLRRAGHFDLEQIEDYEVEKAFIQTIRAGGKTINEDALAKAVEASFGFPYMIQLVGFRSWEEAGQKETIDTVAVSEGIRLAEKDMEARVLRATLDEMSDVDLAFLEAMLPDETKTAVSDICARTGKNESYVARYRIRLIERGAITPSGRGYVAFALPLLKEYLPSYLEKR